VPRLIGYPLVREVLADLGGRSRRPSQIEHCCRVDVSTFHRHAPELVAVKAITRRAVPGRRAKSSCFCFINREGQASVPPQGRKRIGSSLSFARSALALTTSNAPRPTPTAASGGRREAPGQI
jgi:hypothetical protein